MADGYMHIYAAYLKNDHLFFQSEKHNNNILSRSDIMQAQVQ